MLSSLRYRNLFEAPSRGVDGFLPAFPQAPPTKMVRLKVPSDSRAACVVIVTLRVWKFSGKFETRSCENLNAFLSAPRNKNACLNNKYMFDQVLPPAERSWRADVFSSPLPGLWCFSSPWRLRGLFRPSSHLALGPPSFRCDPRASVNIYIDINYVLVYFSCRFSSHLFPLHVLTTLSPPGLSVSHLDDFRTH